MSNISWYYHRLRAMSVPECFYRLKKLRNEKLDKFFYAKPKFVNEIKKREFDIYNKDFLFNLNNLVSSKYLNEIQQINYDIFGKNINLFNEIKWHSCTEDNWSDTKFSKDFTFSNKDDIGEIRYTWEINRHQYLPILAINYKNTFDKKYIKRLKDLFYDWINKNPFLKGVNWSSPMEIALRCYQWLIVYSIIYEDIEENFANDLLNAIINSINYVMKNLSLYSSANNHLIIESAICSLIGHCIQPIYKQPWFQTGYDVLVVQLPLQVHSDGVNKEQATHYHAFVLDMMLQYNFYLKKVNKKPILNDVLFNMTNYLGSIRFGDDILEIGDSDDAVICCLDNNNKNFYFYLLQLASVYFGKKFIQFDEPSPQVKAIAGRLYRNLNSSHFYNSINLFEKGGYAVIKKNPYSLLFDFGELGFGSIAAHGHADALNVVIYYKGKPVLVDAGTYIYNVKQEWRNYFRKTSSHNTVTYKNKDQSDLKGPFLWTRRANAKLLDFGETNDLIFVGGEHDGYNPLIHRRFISIIKDLEIIIISDYFKEVATLNYIFDNNISIKRINNNCIMVNNELYISSQSMMNVADKYISRSFMTKEKTKGLQINHNFSDQNIHFTIISEDRIDFNNNIINYKGRKFLYEDYKTIREIY